GDREGWVYPGAPDESRLASGKSVASSVSPTRTVSVELPVATKGRSVGRLVARVSVASLLPSAIVRTLSPGARLRIINRLGEDVWNDVEPVDGQGLPADRTAWETVDRSASVAPLRIVVSAPTAAYVQPFERAARIGLGVLMLVALVALAMSIALMSRA